MAKPLRADSRQTREDILNASTELFSKSGFGDTSMRSIAKAAGVNLASMNYHFGSKAQLFAATFQHCAAPINAERLRRLDTIEVTTGMPKAAEPTVAEIVRAFVDVGEIGDANWARLIAHIFVEPDSFARPLLQKTFAPTVARFLEALENALPQVPPDVLGLRFHLLVGSMLHLVRFDTPLAFRDEHEKLSKPLDSIDELVKFVVAGLCQVQAAATVERKV